MQFDGATQIITLDSGTTTLDVMDLWSRAVDWWLSDSRWRFPIRKVGEDDVDTEAGTSIPTHCYLQEGWRVKALGSGTLSVVGGVLLVEGGGDPFIDSEGIRIRYQQPVQVIRVQGGATDDLLFADVVPDVTVTPPVLVFYKRGTYGTDAPVVLMRKQILGGAVQAIGLVEAA